MARLIAKSSVLFQSRMFKPGDFLPASDPIMRDAWLEAGTAVLEADPDEIAAAEAEAKEKSDAEAAEADAKAKADAEAAEKKAKAAAAVKAKTEASIAAVKAKSAADAKAKTGKK